MTFSLKVCQNTSKCLAFTCILYVYSRDVHLHHWGRSWCDMHTNTLPTIPYIKDTFEVTTNTIWYDSLPLWYSVIWHDLIQHSKRMMLCNSLWFRDFELTQKSAMLTICFSYCNSVNISFMFLFFMTSKKHWDYNFC